MKLFSTEHKGLKPYRELIEAAMKKFDNAVKGAEDLVDIYTPNFTKPAPLFEKVSQENILLAKKEFARELHSIAEKIETNKI